MASESLKGVLELLATQERQSLFMAKKCLSRPSWTFHPSLIEMNQTSAILWFDARLDYYSPAAFRPIVCPCLEVFIDPRIGPVAPCYSSKFMLPTRYGKITQSVHEMSRRAPELITLSHQHHLFAMVVRAVSSGL
jgi:hypothetical protein